MNRKRFLAASATIAATGAAPHSGVPGGEQLVERRADFDAPAFATTLGRPAAIRQLYEAVAFRPAVFNNIKNAFNGLHFGFGYSADAIAIAFAGHGPSATYGYSDAVWRKYRIGEFFGLVDAAGKPISSNVFVTARAPFDMAANPNDTAAMYHDTSIETLQRRGLVVLTCHTAVEEQARTLVQRGYAPGMTAAAVADDILTHLIPGAVVVPSMVAAIAVLQAEYRYTYLTLVM